MNYKNFFKKLYQISKIVVILLPILLLVWLVNKDLVRSGQLEFIYDFSQTSPTITKLFPENRLSPVIKPADYQIILKEPVYFEVRSPQTFTNAKVEIVYQNDDLPLLQLGLRTNGELDWQYDFKPLENRLLDNLSWFKIENQQATLWQKEKNFLSIEQFLDQADTLDNFAVYNYPLEKKFILPAYRPSDQLTVINQSLRGFHSFYTYLKNDPLEFDFLIQDMNRTDGPDFLKIKVYNNKNEKIYEQEVADDGLVSKNDPAAKPELVKLKLDDLAEGTYKIVLDCEDEIFFRKITTRQRYLTFIDRIYLADQVEYTDLNDPAANRPAVIYSTIPRLGFYTSHQEGLQDVGVGSQSITIDQTHKNYFYTIPDLPALIYVPHNDLKIFGRGLLSLSKDSYFNPEIYDLRELTNFENINYLISSYHLPKTSNGWKTNQVEFSLANAKIDNRKLRFAISAPELNDQGSQVIIKQIKVNLTKKPLSWSEFFEKLVDYLKNKFHVS